MLVAGPKIECTNPIVAIVARRVEDAEWVVDTLGGEVAVALDRAYDGTVGESGQQDYSRRESILSVLAFLDGDFGHWRGSDECSQSGHGRKLKLHLGLIQAFTELLKAWKDGRISENGKRCGKMQRKSTTGKHNRGDFYMPPNTMVQRAEDMLQGTVCSSAPYSCIRT